MNPLSPEQIPAVRQLQTICERLKTQVVIIGAMAYRVWVRDTHRQTYDVDAAVAIDLDELPELTSRLLSEGWTQDGRREHRWGTPDGARIDLIPSGPALRKKGYLEWPVSGMKMSLIGFDHVFANAILYEIAPGLRVHVIPPHVLALLKIVAYLDNPHEREKDVQDLATLFSRYDPGDEIRFGQEILDAALQYDAVPAYLIGKALGSVCSPDERAIVSQLLGQLSTEESRTYYLFSRALASGSDELSHASARGLSEAFALGFTR